MAVLGVARESVRTFAQIVRLNRQRARADRSGAAALSAAAASGAARPFAYDEALGVLAARGVPEFHVREGSMPEASLRFCADVVRRELAGLGRPVRGLHVGNFVGVSLACFTDALRSLDSESVMVSIDPNLTHRGVHDPQQHVLALLDHFGLAASSLVVPAFSLERNLGDDVASAAQPASVEALASLARLDARFDLAVIDGNHDAAYLERELAGLTRLLRPGGLIVLDDVDDAAYPAVVALFERVAGDATYEPLGRDGRAGVLRQVAPAPG
jgi:hypothetical protein